MLAPCRIHSLLFSLLFLASSSAFAEGEPLGAWRPRENAWSLGSTFRKLNLTTGDNDRLQAISPTIDIGRGWVYADWWYNAEISLLLGPNGTSLASSPPLDFTGNGIRLRVAHSLPGQALRAPTGDFGIELGIEYSEWIARSFQERRLADGSLSGDWTVRNRWIFLQPALFYSLWQTPRPQGHKAEWIMTRIEGLVTSFGLSLPLQAQVQFSYNKDTAKRSEVDRWRGTIAFITVTAWLGI